MRRFYLQILESSAIVLTMISSSWSWSWDFGLIYITDFGEEQNNTLYTNSNSWR